MRRVTAGLAVMCVALFLGACDEAGLPTSSADGGQSSQLNTSPIDGGERLVCETMDFSGFEDGDLVEAVSLFDFSVGVSVEAGGEESCVTGTFGDDCVAEARIFDSSQQTTTNDPDLQYPDEGVCEDCQDLGLGNLLIIQQAEGYFLQPGQSDMIPDDSRDGGRISFTGFTGNGEFVLQSFLAVDDDEGEPAFTARVDGSTELSPTSDALGDGTVEKVEIETEHTFFDKFSIEYAASGATDEIEVCRIEERGDEGCTPGYWKQPHHFDSWPMDWTPEGSGATMFCGDVFTCPGGTMLQNPESGNLEDKTLLQALELRGGGVNAMARHAAAAALNASGDTGVEYYYSLSEVQDIVNDALGSQDEWDVRSAHRELSDRNEEMCPLN